MGPPVFRPCFFGVAGVGRHLAPVGEAANPGACNAKLYELVPDGISPFLPQRQVVLRGPALIAVPLDDYPHALVLVEIGGDLLDRRHLVGPQRVTVKLEHDILEGGTLGACCFFGQPLSFCLPAQKVLFLNARIPGPLRPLPRGCVFRLLGRHPLRDGYMDGLGRTPAEQHQKQDCEHDVLH